MNLQKLRADVSALVESQRGQRAMRASTRLLLAATLGFLAYKLTQIGWGEIGQAIPTSPVFYLLFALNWLLLPLTEAVTYRFTWQFDFWRSLPVFFKKHVFNHDVVDYSGEVYLYVWGTKRLGLSEGRAMRTIKDNSIVSSLCGYLVTLILPLFCFACGQLAPQHDFESREIAILVAGPLLIGGICGLLLLFHRAIFSLPLGILAAIGGLHLGRFVLINVLTIVQWSVVMPREPLYVWCTLLAAQNLIGRLPSIVRKDLIFVAVGIELSQELSAPAAVVAGMLLVTSVLDSVTNAAAFAATSLLPRGSGSSRAGAASGATPAGRSRGRVRRVESLA
jgi:hypothetical protein